MHYTQIHAQVGGMGGLALIKESWESLEFQILDKIYILIRGKCWLENYITCHCQWIEIHEKLNKTYHESRYNNSLNILQNLKTTISTIYKLIFFFHYRHVKSHSKAFNYPTMKVCPTFYLTYFNIYNNKGSWSRWRLNNPK